MNSLTRTKVPLVAGISATVLAVGLYGALGRPDLASASNPQLQPGATTHPASAVVKRRKLASVDQLLSGLEQRLQDNPDDGKGWLLLAKSYDHLGQTQDAAAAWSKAVALGIDDAAFTNKFPAPGPQVSVRYPIDSDDLATLELIIE